MNTSPGESESFRFSPVHLEYLKSCEPVRQLCVGKSPKAWAQNAGIEPVGDLPDETIDRDKVMDICRDPARHAWDGFICAMAWGGQGAGRSKWKVLNAMREQRSTICELLQRIRDSAPGRAQAFEMFRSPPIKYLGPAYFTKLIHFFSDPDKHAYIMDQWTAKSMNLLLDFDLVKYLDQSTTSSVYERFCSGIDQLAFELSKSGTQISGARTEELLFSRGGRVHLKLPWRKYVVATYKGRLNDSYL